MRNTTTYSSGDVVLARFVFTDESGAKRRPVVVVSSQQYQRGRQEIIVVAITSNVDRLLIGDHLISNWEEAGLLFPSVATGIVRTLKQSTIDRRLGAMYPTDMSAVQGNLRLIFGLH